MAINPVSISSNALTALQNAASAAKSQATSAAATSTTPASATQSFDQMLTSLTDSQNQSDDLVQQLASGNSVDLHNVMIGLEENDINFRVSMAIRDKLVDAYKEVMRMEI